MNLSSITAATAYTSQLANTTTKKTTDPTTAAADTATAESTSDTAVIYEKSSDASSAVQTDKKAQNAAIVAQMKADSEARTAQLQSLVEKMLTKQGLTLATADDMWSFLAKGDFTADADTIEQAKKDVAEDGYWGAEQTSDRILSFAKALAGDDPDNAEEMLNAFKKGYEEATKTWGDELPSLCSDTYDLVEKKFNEWKNSGTDNTTSLEQ